jgi:hypothetical protein
LLMEYVINYILFFNIRVSFGRGCFGYCNSLQIPEHRLLHCKYYAKERRVLAKALQKPRPILPLLFNTTKGSAALLGFLEDTEIATARWLLAAGAL